MGEVINRQDAYSWSISRIAEAFGMDRRTVKSRIDAAGVMPAGTRKGNAVYALADIGPALFGDTQQQAFGVMSIEDMLPKDRKDWFQSENERLKYEKEIRQLIPSHEFAREISKLARGVVNTLDMLPDLLERDVGLTPDAINRVVEALDGAREQMYQALTADSETDEEGSE